MIVSHSLLWRIDRDAGLDRNGWSSDGEGWGGGGREGGRREKWMDGRQRQGGWWEGVRGKEGGREETVGGGKEGWQSLRLEGGEGGVDESECGHF